MLHHLFGGVLEGLAIDFYFESDDYNFVAEFLLVLIYSFSLKILKEKFLQVLIQVKNPTKLKIRTADPAIVSDTISTRLLFDEFDVVVEILTEPL
mgnify:CR=1 FL=1